MRSPIPIQGVARYLVADPLVVRAMRKQFGVAAKELIEQIRSGLAPTGAAVEAVDFLHDLLINRGRLYMKFTANGSHGGYPIEIHGLGGVYFYRAPEFGCVGFFISIDDASGSIASNWSDSLVSHGGRECRPPFVNVGIAKILREAEIVESNQEAEERVNRVRAIKLMDTKGLDESQDAWGVLLDGAAVRDAELCARLLQRWYALRSTQVPDASVWGDRRILRVTMASTDDVKRALKTHGALQVIESITRDEFLSAIRDIRAKRPSQGAHAKAITLPSGNVVTHLHDKCDGLGWLYARSAYRSMFGNPPDWVSYLHPYHGKELCRLAIHRAMELPRQDPETT